jgi:hypothetical protein
LKPLRILHMLDPEAGDEGVLACAALLRAGDAEHRVWLAGSTRFEARCESLGVRTTDLVPAPLGRAELAWRRVRRLADDRDADVREGAWADVVQCYSLPSLALARLAIGKRRPPRVGFLARPPAVRPAGRARFALHDSTLVCCDDATANGYAEAASARRGGTFLRDNIRRCDPPAIPFRADAAAREHARARLGLSPDDRAVAFLMDPPSAGDAMRAAFVVGLAYVAGTRGVAIVPRGAAHARRAARFVRTHGRSWGLLLTDGFSSPHASSGSTLVRLAVDRGLPVVTPPDAVASSALVGARAFTALNRTPTALGEALVRALAAPVQAPPAPPPPAPSDFLPTITAVWREVANVPVLRPGLPTPVLLAGSPA